MPSTVWSQPQQNLLPVNNFHGTTSSEVTHIVDSCLFPSPQLAELQAMYLILSAGCKRKLQSPYLVSQPVISQPSGFIFISMQKVPCNNLQHCNCKKRKDKKYRKYREYKHIFRHWVADYVPNWLTSVTLYCKPVPNYNHIWQMGKW